jgi:purine-binding chemotaxis protein CheW
MNIEKDHGVKTCLSFKLSEEVFAINVSKVINILEMSHITRIPKAPEYMKGVINLRGIVLPVVDLRIKFGLPEKETTVDTSIIVLSIDLNGDPILIGTLVDAVREVLELKNDEISPAPTIGTKYNSGLIEGMWRVDDKFIMILDIDKVFSTDEIIDFKEQTEQSINEVNNK